MVRRWTALGVVTAQKEFRRIKGYRHMGALVHDRGELGKPESQAIGGELSWAAKRCRARTNGLMHQRRAARPSAAQAIGLDWRGPNQMSNVSQAECTNTLAPPPWIS